MRDPYEVLGVTRSASAADIKSAFRRLAKKLLPDANKHDPKAASRFAEINAAYEIIGDKDKRKAFDGGEIDAEGKPRFQGFEGFGQQPGAGAGGFARDGAFETFTWGSEGAHASGGRSGARGLGGFGYILKVVFGARGAGRARAGVNVHFEPEDFGAAAGSDISASLSITLA